MYCLHNESEIAVCYKISFFSNGAVNCVLTGLLFDNLANYNELKIQLFLGCFVIVDVVVVIIV